MAEPEGLPLRDSCKAPTLHMMSINFMTELTSYNFVFKCLSLFRRNHNPLAMNFGANRHFFKKKFNSLLLLPSV